MWERVGAVPAEVEVDDGFEVLAAVVLGPLGGSDAHVAPKADASLKSSANAPLEAPYFNPVVLVMAAVAL